VEHRRELRGDCAACQGLCCVSLGFERSEWFAFDKPPGTACPSLERANTCAVHEQLAAAGLAGCKSYDCYGAGQRTCLLFAGKSWRDDDAHAHAMFTTFDRLRRLHELRWLLHEAGRLTLEPAHAAEREQLLAELEPDSESSLERLAAIDLDELDLRTRRLLQSLRGYFPGPARLRLRVLNGSGGGSSPGPRSARKVTI
jgi:hypothetical protein